MTIIKSRAILFALIAVVLAAAPLAAQSNPVCLTCHSDSGLTMNKKGKDLSLFVHEAGLNRSAHQSLDCVSCHEGFSAESVPHKARITPVNCRTCHDDVGLKHQFHPQLLQAIAEKRKPDVSCTDCHGSHEIVSSKVPGSKFAPENLSTACGECHGAVNDHFIASAHGKALTAHAPGAPSCISCHEKHVTGVDTTEAGRKVKMAQVELCLSCHLDNPDVKARVAPNAKFIAAYEQSVHGAALAGGNANAANCVDCHGSHDMKKGMEVSATVNKLNIEQTCAKCHETIQKDFHESIHGTALAMGNLDAPTCTNCHGEHGILKHTDPRSPVATANLSAQVCSPCHSSLGLSTKYGMSSDRFKTFDDSYHGLAMRGGSVEVANCASCHGVHNIKPSSDSTSMISKANLAATCGKCHPGANERFAVGSVHVTMTAQEEPLLYWIATGYLIMIIVVIGGMMVHNILDFVRKSKRKLMMRRGLIEHEKHGHSLYLRMTLSERLQHGALVISFLTLVVTGFMLRFPDAWWVQAMGDWIFNARTYIHRVAAVVMVLASFYHLYYVLFTERGKQLIRDLLPRLRDASDAVAVMKYNLGISNVKPKLDRFSYIEKSEYWALVWGTIVMAATGFIMWFDNTFIGLLTKLGYDIARTVHYYEAWLATLAIIVWHFYFVIFNPDVYPINLAFWKGTLTEEEMADEHALELERLKAGEELDAVTEEPAPAAADEPVKKEIA